MKKKNYPTGYCKKKGYHEWEVTDISGTLPTQEVELQCSICERQWSVIMELEDDDDVTQSEE
jgi:hypothetical protein